MELYEYQQFNREEEVELFTRMKAGDTEARQLLIESQLAWVRELTGRFNFKLGIADTEDSESAARLHLIRIIDNKFDPERGRLTTLVSIAIPRFLSRWWNQNYLIKPPQCNPTLCAYPERVEKVKRVMTLDLRPDDPGQEHRPNRIEPSYRDPDQGERIDREERARRLRRTIAKLPKRQRQIVRWRMEGKTLETIGSELGICKERVRQLQASAHRFIHSKHPEWWK